jgi:hypothetical protein
MQSVPIPTDDGSSNLDQGEVYNIMWSSLSVTCDRSVVFSGSSTNINDFHDITEIWNSHKNHLSGTSSSIRTKLWWNSHWMVLFQNCVRQSRSPTKMATTVQLRCYWKVWFQLSYWFQTRRFLCEFPIGYYVKLSSAVGAILVERSNRQTHFWKRTIDHGQATGKHYHLRLRVECTVYCNLQSGARTHAILVIVLYVIIKICSWSK